MFPVSALLLTIINATLLGAIVKNTPSWILNPAIVLLIIFVVYQISINKELHIYAKNLMCPPAQVFDRCPIPASEIFHEGHMLVDRYENLPLSLHTFRVFASMKIVIIRKHFKEDSPSIAIYTMYIFSRWNRTSLYAILPLSDYTVTIGGANPVEFTKYADGDVAHFMLNRKASSNPSILSSDDGNYFSPSFSHRYSLITPFGGMACKKTWTEKMCIAMDPTLNNDLSGATNKFEEMEIGHEQIAIPSDCSPFNMPLDIIFNMAKLAYVNLLPYNFSLLKIESIELGSCLPTISNPHLIPRHQKPCEGSARRTKYSCFFDVEYEGGFELSISTIRSGLCRDYPIKSRVKVLKSSGELEVRIHPGSDRLWYGFTATPKMQLEVDLQIDFFKVPGLPTALKSILRSVITSCFVEQYDDILIAEYRNSKGEYVPPFFKRKTRKHKPISIRVKEAEAQLEAERLRLIEEEEALARRLEEEKLLALTMPAAPISTKSWFGRMVTEPSEVSSIDSPSISRVYKWTSTLKRKTTLFSLRSQSSSSSLDSSCPTLSRKSSLFSLRPKSSNSTLNSDASLSE